MIFLIGAYVLSLAFWSSLGPGEEVSKCWFNRIWFKFGTPVTQQRWVVGRTWMKQVYPPYFTGRGVSIQLGYKSVRIGICRPLYLQDDYDVEREIRAAQAMPTAGWSRREKKVTRCPTQKLEEASASSLRARPLLPEPSSSKPPNAPEGSPRQTA